jgi:hypothetical protein
MKSCRVLNCKNEYYSKGLCKKHYDKNRRHGDPLYIEILRKDDPCSIKGCDKPFFANDLCQMHNARLKRHGDPLYINPKCNRDGKYKERHKEYYKQWLKENWSDQKAYRAARKKRVKEATPKWADLKAIEVFYKACPPGYHVDHIIPLFGKIVCGLHVINNLQYLPAHVNLSKGNKYE